MPAAKVDFTQFEKGSAVWLETGNGISVPAEVVEIDDESKRLLVRPIYEKENYISVTDPRQVRARMGDSFDVDDLIQIGEMSDAAILWTLRNRYERDVIYTYIGRILVSVNPYKITDLYCNAVMQKYKNQVIGSLPPHIFAIGDSMYKQMLTSGDDQVAVINGESGSGKTEASKLLMQYLAATAACSGNGHSTNNKRAKIMSGRILDSALILESFGNAKTVLNDNASRFGKYTEIFFKQGCIQGARITDYMLEKSRIVTQASEERNFHIFYQLLTGLRPELKEKFGLYAAGKYFYLNQGKCSEISDRSDHEDFKRVYSALDVLGFTSDQQHTVFRILAAILHLGNLYFHRQQLSNQTEGVCIGNESEVQWVAYLLQLDSDQLKAALTTRFTETKGESATTPLDIDRALDVRAAQQAPLTHTLDVEGASDTGWTTVIFSSISDAIAKGLYSQLFAWLVSRINQICHKDDDRDSSIALLDIYGFERFQVNSFEQLCVNFANERLHCYFVDTIFKTEQADYVKEKIVWEGNIGSQLDNGRNLDILIKRPHGIFHLLDDECNFPKASDESFLRKCHYNHVDNPLYGKPRMHYPEFCVKHYAGLVRYQAPGFLDKNKDILKENLVDLLAESQNTILSAMFKSLKDGSLSLTRGSGKDRVVFRSKHQTVSAEFNESLITMLEKLRKCKPHFVRCVKPNQDKLPNTFDLQLVIDQLRYLGILDTLKIRRVGYPTKYDFRSFARKYGSLVLDNNNVLDGENPRESTYLILTQLGHRFSDQYQIGTTKVFLKEPLQEHLEVCRGRVVRDAAVVIQKYAKAYLGRKKYLRMKSASIKLQSALRGWQARNKYTKMKKEMYKDAEKQAKRSRRLQVYEQMQNKRNQQLHHQSSNKQVLTAVDHLDVPKDLRYLLKNTPDSVSRRLEQKVVRTHGDILHCQPQHSLPHDLHEFPFANFAQAYCKGHTWQMRREPITTPFLPKDSDEDFNESLKIFKLILRFMNESSLNPAQEAILADYIIQQFSYVTNTKCDGYGPVITRQLLQAAYGDNGEDRRYPPCMLEHVALRKKAKMAIEATLSDGKKSVSQIDSWCTSAEFAERILRQRGVADVKGWTVSLEAPDLDIFMGGNDYVLDVMSYLELPRDFPASTPNFVVAANPAAKRLGRNRNFREENRDDLIINQENELPDSDESVPSEPKHSPEMVPKSFSPSRSEFTTLSPRQFSEFPVSENLSTSRHPTTQEAIRGEQEVTGSRFCATPQRNEMMEVIPNPPPPPPPPPQVLTSNVIRNGSSMGQSSSSKDFEVQERATTVFGGSVSTQMVGVNGDVPDVVLPSTYDSSTIRSSSTNTRQYDLDSIEPVYAPGSQGIIHVLQDATLEDVYDSKSLAASIKGGGELANQNSAVGSQPMNSYPVGAMPQMNQPMIMVVPMDPRICGSVQQMQAAWNPMQQTEQQNFNFQTVQSGNANVPCQQPVAGGQAMGYVPFQFPTFMQPMPLNQGMMAVPMGVQNQQFVPQIKQQAVQQLQDMSVSSMETASTISQQNTIVSETTDRSTFYGVDELAGQRIPSPPTLPPEPSFPAPPPPRGSQARDQQAPLPPAHSQQTPQYWVEQRQENGEIVPPVNMIRDDRPAISAPREDMNGYINDSRQQQFVVGKMRPSNSAARYVGPSEDVEVRRIGHKIRDVAREARRSISPPMQPRDIPVEEDLIRQQQQFRSPHEESYRHEGPEVYRSQAPEFQFYQRSVAEMNSDQQSITPTPSPRIDASAFVPNETIRGTEPHRMVFLRPKNTEEELQAEALVKMQEKSKDLPPPIDEAQPAPPEPEFEDWVEENEVGAIRETVQRKAKPPTLTANGDIFPAPTPPEERRRRMYGGPQRAPNSEMKPRLPVIAEEQHKEKKKGPVYSYDDVPWEMTVRKEVFFPGERLDDPQELDLVFYQIVRDCFKSNPFRIRSREREQMMTLLKSYQINPGNMSRGHISQMVKDTVVETAREWPLYFCRLFPVVEDRSSEFVAQLLGVSESGIRLIVRNYDSLDEPLKILDHFDFDDIDMVDVPEPKLLRLTTVRGLQVRVFTEKAEQIKQLVDDYLFGPNQGKQYVRAVSDYISKEPTLLSFRKGDLIQLVSNVQQPIHDDQLQPGTGWLYGKLNNTYGNFPSDYVEPVGGCSTVNQDSTTEIYGSTVEGSEDGMEEQWVHANGVVGGMTSGMKPKGEKLTMMEFAMMYFRHGPQKYEMVRSEDGSIKGAVKDDRKSSKKEWTWKEIADQVKFSKVLPNASLLRLENADYNKMALDCFVSIMRYMGDAPVKKGQTLTDCVYELLMVCHRNPPMRDEIYCQVMKQTTNNKSAKADSAIKGWRLFSMLTAYFDCSEVLKPYLFKYLSDAAGDTRRAYHGTAMVCLQNLKKTFKYGGRKFLLGAKEIEAITFGKNLKRQIYHLPGGHKKVVNTKSVTVVEEIIQDLCQELNIRSPLEQQEFCLCYILEAENVMKLLSNDEYILDVTTELEHKQKEYFLLLKRTVWIHPLRLDNELYIDVMFFQLVPDYLEGLLVNMRTPETISAAVMDDIAKLGALLHRGDDEWRGNPVDSRSVSQLLPRIIQNVRHVPLEQWSDRINSKLSHIPESITTSEARARFLEILQDWSLFGSTFFYIMNVTDPRVQGECLLAINRQGIQFLHIITHECLVEFRLTEVLSTHKVTAAPPMGGPPMQFLDLKIGNQMQQRVITLQTDQGTEISRLLGQYIYVDSQNRNFISGNAKTNGY